MIFLSLKLTSTSNTGDAVAITSFGKMDEPPGSPDTPSLQRIRTRVPSTDSLNNVSDSFQLMSKSVEGVLNEKYPAYKDRHKLALEREKQIKEKADQARAQRFSDTDSKVKLGGAKTPALPPKLTQLKEKPAASSDSSDPSNNDNKAVDPQAISKMKLSQIEKRAPRAFRPPPKASKGGASVTKNANPSVGSPSVLPSPPGGAPPPPPPPGGPPRPPPPPGSLPRGGGGGDKVHRAPELVEFYQTLMKRESKKETSSLVSSTSNASDARSNVIGEFENKSSFLLAVC